MRTIIYIIFFLFPVFSMGQFATAYPCIDGEEGILTAEVQSDSVVLHDDIVCRNCLAWYSMEITSLGNNQLIWLQHDVGETAACICNFNLSVTIDSLQTGTYTTFVYYTEQWYGDTIYIGSISFTITDPIPYNSPLVQNQYQSYCNILGLSSGNISSIPSQKIYPNPAEGTITFASNEEGTLFIFDFNGLQLLRYQISKPTTTIDISILQDGIYFIEFVGENGVQVGKFVKQ